MGCNCGEVGIMPYAVSNDARIYYEVIGSGPPIALIEGLGYAMWMWVMQLQDLSVDHKLIVFDNRGVGKSDKPNYPYTIEMFAEDLKTVLDESKVESAHILGVSMGGMIAQKFALIYPDRVRSLILVGTHQGGQEVEPPPMETLQAMFGPKPPHITSERELYRYKMRYAFSKTWYERNQELVDRLIDLRIENPQPPEAYLNQASAIINFDVSTSISRIEIPTLIIHGEEDLVVPVGNAYKIHKKLRSSTLVIFKGSGHLVNIERHREFNELVRLFIRAVEKKAYRPSRRPIMFGDGNINIENVLSGGV
jgi:pimeloyl-ACP methyl ester carboxylesterase